MKALVSNTKTCIAFK